jgi:predicted nucleic acid-binding protein
VTLTDTGPLVALLDRNDPHHARCLAAAQTLPVSALVTTLPCLTEAMHFVAEEGGYEAQQRLWRLWQEDKLCIHPWDEAEAGRMMALMARYADAPMDFADASLVAAAESLGLTRIFTLDHHLYAYQINGKTPFDVFP